MTHIPQQPLFMTLALIPMPVLRCEPPRSGPTSNTMPVAVPTTAVGFGVRSR